jgi:FkbM family methyltransferase
MSNTFGLYCEGWRGLNVDINNKLIEQFRTIRHRDISICAAVSDIEKDLVIYEFEHHLGTTVDKELSEKFVKEMNWKIVSQRTVRAQTLNSLIEKHNLQEQEIDFMSVDVEGHDLNVLKSLDLDRYRPKLIIAEALNFNIRKFWENELCIYLEMKGYNFLGYIAETCYFADKKF